MQILNTEKLTQVEDGILSYLKEHADQILELSIGDLARETYTSKATVVRLCKKLGFHGYRDFRFSFLQEQEARKFMTRTIDLAVPFVPDENCGELIQSISTLYKETIDTVTAGLDQKMLQKAADLLLSADRIFLFAIGDSMITVQTFQNRLKKIGLYAILATERQEEIASNLTLKAGDCAFFLSYSGVSSSYAECIRNAVKARCRIITVTANTKSLMYQYSSCAITIPEQADEEKLGTLYSQIAFHYILTLLYSLIYTRNYHNNGKLKQLILDAEKQQKTF